MIRNNGYIEKVKKIKNIKDDEIMTIGEVSAYLKISERIIVKLVEDGEIPYFTIGGHWRTRKADISDFIDTLIQGKRV